MIASRRRLIAIVNEVRITDFFMLSCAISLSLLLHLEWFVIRVFVVFLFCLMGTLV